MPSSGPAKARALVIVDQLGFDAVPTNSARWPFVASPHRLTLGYIPRTTPVGHATISTGAVPSLHLIQGREWCHSAVPHPLNIDDLPRGRLDPRIAIPLGRRSLARRIRNSDPRARIVIAAAKAFIPFLFGADDADVSIYPTETKPQKDTQGRYRLVICVDPRSSPGNASLHRRALDVFAQTQRFVRSLAPGSGLEFRMRHRILELHWIVPSALASPSAWRDLVVDHGPDIDAYYGNVAQLFAADLGSQDDDAPTYLIHSWFSTDMRAHVLNPSHARYRQAVEASMDHVASLHRAGYTVAVTSDHGGRATPELVTWHKGVARDRSGATIPTRPAHRIILSGDHLVGYDAAPAPHPIIEYWNGAALRTVALEPTILAASFARDQMPSWLLLPRHDEKFGGIGLINGGDHGACVDPRGRVSDVDDGVPLFVAGPSPSTFPSRLDEVAAWFIGL